MRRAILFPFLISCAPVALGTHVSALSGAVSVRDYGALCDGATDDREAFQNALNSGAAEVDVPIGTCMIGQGAGFFGVTIPAGVTLRGASRDGTVLRQTPGIGASVRLLQPIGAGATVDTMTLDGDADEQTVDEHRAGVFASSAPGATIRHVTARDFTGDGFYVYIGSNDVVVDDVIATANHRNGITFGGRTTGGMVTSSRFVGNAVQQFDSEPGAGFTVDGLTLIGNTFDGAGASGDYVLTISGGGSTARSHGWRVEGNTINGGIWIVWADGTLVRGNAGLNTTDRPCVRVYRTGDGTQIDGNTFSATVATNLIAITGAGTGQAPSHVLVTRNDLRSGTAAAYGVVATGAVSIDVSDNVLHGPGAVAVYARSTNPSEDFRSAIIRRNRITSWSAGGVVVRGNSTAKLLMADVSDNIFDDTPTAASLDDDHSGALQAATVAGNVLLGSSATLISTWPTGTTLDATATAMVLHRSQ